MRLRRRPADERSLHLLGEELLEVRPHVLGADEDDAWPAQRPDAPVERLRDATPVAVDDLVDVSLVPRLRPAALIVLPGHVVAFVGDLDEAAAVEPVHLAALAADGSDERVPGAAREPRERRKVELCLELHLVGDGIRQRDRAPEVVERRGEDGDAAHPLTLEAVVEPLRDPLDVALQTLPLLVGEGGLALVEHPLRLRQQRIHARLDVLRRRHLARVEVHVEADRASLLGAEAGQLSQLLPGDRPCHDFAFPLPAVLDLTHRFRPGISRGSGAFLSVETGDLK